MDTAEVHWSAYLACEVCKACAGEPCRVRSGGGPQALPDILAERPHSSRPLSAAAKKTSSSPSRRVAAGAVPVRSGPPAWLRPAGSPSGRAPTRHRPDASTTP